MKHFILIFILILVMFPAHAIVAEQKVEIEISGMTCSLCIVAVKKSLSKINGIKDIKVSYKDEKAWFTLEDSLTDDTALIEAVRNAGGYKVEAIHRK
jgi:copper chaperone CopZ